MKNEKKKCNSKCADADIKSNQLNDSNLENVNGGFSKGIYGYCTTDMYGQPKIGFKTEEEVLEYEKRRDEARRNQISQHFQNAIKFFQNPGNN